MKKIIRLTESDLTRLVRRVIKEQEDEMTMGYEEKDTTRRQLMLRNKSADVVSKHLNNLSDEINADLLNNSQYAYCKELQGNIDTIRTIEEQITLTINFYNKYSQFQKSQISMCICAYSFFSCVS
jgi:signal transduction histidine kinase